jgi:hypothetical protein
MSPSNIFRILVEIIKETPRVINLHSSVMWSLHTKALSPRGRKWDQEKEASYPEVVIPRLTMAWLHIIRVVQAVQGCF